MQLAIFAATGGTGRRLLYQAEAAGHDVTAVVRDPAKLPAGGFSASRANVADLMLRVLEDPDTVGQPVGIAR